MKFLLDELEAQQQGTHLLYNVSALQRAYQCRCDRAVFFGNTGCLSCGSALGYEPHLGRVFALNPGAQPGTWQIHACAGPQEQHNSLYRRCANLSSHAVCNWLVKIDPETDRIRPETFCVSCRLTRIIPDLSIPENGALWGKIEAAKRRVVSALIALELPVRSRVSEDLKNGLAFDFLQSPLNGPRVLTGHNNGLITLNLDEADDVKREQTRNSMHEPYRTLVGHFRHEVGHYYWDRLVAGSEWLPDFRSLFGDERTDYAASLKKNYVKGPQPGWWLSHISAYASIHPWEDWAETWAHYMHMLDTLGTALSFGLKPGAVALPFDPFGPEVLYDQHRPGASRFLSFFNDWLKLTAVMNELCRSMGQPDFYPFAVARTTVTKLHFIHTIVSEGCTRSK